MTRTRKNPLLLQWNGTTRILIWRKRRHANVRLLGLRDILDYLGADVGDEAERDGDIDLGGQLSSGGQLVCQETPADYFCARAHHDRSARIAAVFPNQLVMVDAGDLLMRAGGSGRRSVIGHEESLADDEHAKAEGSSSKARIIALRCISSLT